MQALTTHANRRPALARRQAMGAQRVRWLDRNAAARAVSDIGTHYAAKRRRIPTKRDLEHASWRRLDLPDRAANPLVRLESAAHRVSPPSNAGCYTESRGRLSWRPDHSRSSRPTRCSRIGKVI